MRLPLFSRNTPVFCAEPSITPSSIYLFSSSPESWRKLYRRRVKHDADGGTERLGGEVGSELGANDTAVAVRPGDLAPDDADLGALDGALSTVDVYNAINSNSSKATFQSEQIRTCYALTAVPLCGIGVIDALKLQQRSARVSVALSGFRQRYSSVRCIIGHTLAGSCDLVSNAFIAN